MTCFNCFARVSVEYVGVLFYLFLPVVDFKGKPMNILHSCFFGVSTTLLVGSKGNLLEAGHVCVTDPLHQSGLN